MGFDNTLFTNTAFSPEPDYFDSPIHTPRIPNSVLDRLQDAKVIHDQFDQYNAVISRYQLRIPPVRSSDESEADRSSDPNRVPESNLHRPTVTQLPKRQLFTAINSRGPRNGYFNPDSTRVGGISPHAEAFPDTVLARIGDRREADRYTEQISRYQRGKSVPPPQRQTSSHSYLHHDSTVSTTSRGGTEEAGEKMKRAKHQPDAAVPSFHERRAKG
eukprot:2175921-Rhodomonas_salina.1